MEEHPKEIVDINKLENSDLHDWKLVGKVVEPTLEKDGYADYICRIDKCGQTKHVVLPKLTPEEMREVGVIYWDAAAQAAPAALQGMGRSADELTATAENALAESLPADKANWKLAEDVGDLMIHPAADAAGTVYEQAVKASGCQYYVIANVTAQYTLPPLPCRPQAVQTGWRWWALPSAACSCWPQALCRTARTAA